MLPAATDVIETMICESYAKEFGNIQLADNIVGSKISYTSKALCYQRNDKLKTLRFALRMGKIIDVIKGLHFIIYV
jgi:hypothetical protein